MRPIKPTSAAPSRKEWTTGEISILLDLYPSSGPKAVAERLGRSLTSVYARARKHKLIAPQRDISSYYSLPVSPDVDAKIRAYLTSGKLKKGSLKDFCTKSGLTRAFVRSRALKLGLVVPSGKSAPWTREEDALLEDNCHLSPNKLWRRFRAAGFQRTETALVLRRSKLSLDTLDPDRYDLTVFARFMGVEPSVVERWIASGELKVSRDSPKGFRIRISRNDFRAWAKTHAHEVAKHSRKADQQWLVELLLGV